MDPSALIFVALAVAWAVYLVPKALEHHDESLRSRTVSTFSHTMRVLARREPVSRRRTRLVPGAPAAPAAEVRAQRASKPQVSAPQVSKRPRSTRRSAAARRRNVLVLLLVANAAVAGVAGFGVIGWVWMAAPAALLVAWLVACRLMVRRERSVRRPGARRPAATSASERSAASPAEVVDETGAVAVVLDESAVIEGAILDDDTAGIPAVTTGRWDPVDVPLPTYVSKPPAARRTVRTIDLDSTGVWSSGRSETDSALAREADAARREAREDRTDRRATGS